MTECHYEWAIVSNDIGILFTHFNLIKAVIILKRIHCETPSTHSVHHIHVSDCLRANVFIMGNLFNSYC
jgi:hypothetical protein